MPGLRVQVETELPSRLNTFGVAALVTYIVLVTRIIIDTYKTTLTSGCLGLFLGTLASAIINSIIAFIIFTLLTTL